MNFFFSLLLDGGENFIVSEMLDQTQIDKSGGEEEGEERNAKAIP